MLFSKVPTNAGGSIVTVWLRSPPLCSAQSRTTIAVAIFVKLPIWRFCFDSCSCKTAPVCASTMMKACAGKAERSARKRSAAATATKRRVKITGLVRNGRTLIAADQLATREKGKVDVFRQTDVAAFAVTVRIRAQSQINSLSRIYEIEVRCSSETARTNRPVSALEAAATGHVKFVNDGAPIDIGNPNVERQKRLAGAKTTSEEASIGISAVDHLKVTLDQPAGARRFRILQDSGRRDFFQLFFQIIRKLHWRQCFTNWHLTVAQSLVTFEHRRVDAERSNINSVRIARPYPAIGNHVD